MNGPFGAVARSVPGDGGFLNDSIHRGREGLALLHGGIERVPRPIFGAVQVANQVLPGVQFDLAWSVHIQPVDGGTAYIVLRTCILSTHLTQNGATYLPALCHGAIHIWCCWPQLEGRCRSPNSALSARAICSMRLPGCLYQSRVRHMWSSLVDHHKGGHVPICSRNSSPLPPASRTSTV